MTDTEAPPARSRVLPIAVAAVAGLLVVLAAVVPPLVLGGDDDEHTRSEGGRWTARR